MNDNFIDYKFVIALQLNIFPCVKEVTNASFVWPHCMLNGEMWNVKCGMCVCPSLQRMKGGC